MLRQIASQPSVAHARVDAAVGDDLHIAVGQQEIDQHAVVVLGVPHAQRREHLDRAFPRRHTAQQLRQIERVLDREADLSGVRGFALADGLLDRVQQACRERPPHAPGSREQMSQYPARIACATTGPKPRRRRPAASTATEAAPATEAAAAAAPATAAPASARTPAPFRASRANSINTNAMMPTTSRSHQRRDDEPGDDARDGADHAGSRQAAQQRAQHPAHHEDEHEADDEQRLQIEAVTLLRPLPPLLAAAAAARRR